MKRMGNISDSGDLNDIDLYSATLFTNQMATRFVPIFNDTLRVEISGR
jgi:hypothetical protein